jgi:hypothetical protein
MKSMALRQLNVRNVLVRNAKTLKNITEKMNSMEPRNTREHIITLQGHVTGVKRELYHIKKQQEQTHEHIEKTVKKLDWILGLIIAGLGFLASKAFIGF